MAPHPIPLPCDLAFPPPSHRDTTTLSSCWAPHFMTQECIMFSNPTTSKPRLPPAATISDGTTSALTPPFTAPPSCSLQPLLKLSLLSLRPFLLQFVSIVSPHSPSLRRGLPAPPPSRRRQHAQSLLGPSFHDPRMHHVLESHPEQAAPLSRRDDERRHAICSHSVLALRFHLVAYSPSSSCRFSVLGVAAAGLKPLRLPRARKRSQ